jgi:hypothetical protein
MSAEAPRVVPAPPLQQLPGEAPESAEAHRLVCTGKSKSCTWCRFFAGYEGQQRKGQKTLQTPRAAAAWKNKFLFKHPITGKVHTWITWASGGAGCWVCNVAGETDTFGKIAVSGLGSMQASNFKRHENSPGHRNALKLLQLGVDLSLVRWPDRGSFTGSPCTVRLVPDSQKITKQNVQPI